ncbi:hypothetical protein NMA510612_1547 [Neisseria meningitidis]|uniref:Uncharacterized protein n=2 Tax=Neisseria meningitidis TaxID=487 RepID=X5ES32_NEIME|nr:hypothetical protein NMA510612_1547 [Neisseria meningitidis]CBA03444.1 hypothetical protein predicted by Glimmer/Critica [Neisseria meningitidis alpha153]
MLLIFFRGFGSLLVLFPGRFFVFLFTFYVYFGFLTEFFNFQAVSASLMAADFR